jgi:O-antigen ligase
MASSKWLLWLERAWRGTLQTCFLLLCLRFLLAATRETYPDVLPVLVLTAGGLVLSAWRPRAALFAFAVSVPLLNGLGYVGLAGLPTPVSLVFSGVFVGYIIRQLSGKGEAQGADPEVTGLKSDLEPITYDPRPDRAVLATGAEGEKRKAESEKHEAEGGAMDSRSCSATEAGEREAKSRATDAQSYGTIEAGELGSNPKPKTQTPKLSPVRLAADVLITAVLVSLVVQIVRNQDSPELWKVFWNQSGFGFGDPLYFITSAFVWLQGLFFFRMLSAKGTEERGNGGARDKGEEQGAEQQRGMREKGSEGLGEWGMEHGAEGGAVTTWIKPAFAVYGVTLVGFFLIQAAFKIPEPNQSVAPDILFSPLEDIHSFGSFAVALLVFAVASWQWKTLSRTVFHGVWIMSLLALTIASWSRATWLAGALVLLLVAWIRLPKKWTAAFVVIGAIAVIVLNVNANRESWQRNEYLMRLISLVRIENLGNKDLARVLLYQKAAGMIREHPFVGHGIGSVYLTSVRFARPGDPWYAELPNFAHNFLLQMAAELGVPVAALFAALIGTALWRGYRAARSLAEVPGSKSQVSRIQPPTTAAPQIGSSVPSAESPEKADTILTPDSCLLSPQHEMLAVTMALVAYLITQMTANALNIYVSNQFFFWFLMAAALSVNTKIAKSAAAYPSASISVD